MSTDSHQESDNRPATRAPRISLFIGTKAQFIKMIPVAWALEARGLPYRLINTGQHESISSDLRKQYSIREPDYSLGNRRSDVNTLGRGLAWLGGNVVRYAVRGGHTRRTLFDGSKGVVLVHGDTASTLLSTLIAKRAGQKVMHIEAGLRSWRVLNPFPEELIRILVMRMSDYLVAPSPDAYENLRSMSVKGRIWHVSGNTGQDIVSADLESESGQVSKFEQPYSAVTIHRLETLYNRARMQTVVDAILKAHRKAPACFVQHGPTAKRLAAYGMLDRLEEAGVRQMELMEHRRFVHFLNDAEFVLTDGGSVQEEMSYLGVPCLLMRSATERPDGLDKNVVLSKMDVEIIDDFIENHGRYRRPPVDFRNARPSAEIADILNTLIG